MVLCSGMSREHKVETLWLKCVDDVSCVNLMRI